MLKTSLSVACTFSRINAPKWKESWSSSTLQGGKAPTICWGADRIASDLELSRRLIAKLDIEKGISENELLGGEGESEAVVKEEAVKEEPVKEVEERNEGKEKTEEKEEKKEANGTADSDTKMDEAGAAADKIDETPKAVDPEGDVYLRLPLKFHGSKTSPSNSAGIIFLESHHAVDHQAI